MHSNIIQISKNPIDREDWVTPSDLYDNSQDFADYIGDKEGGQYVGKLLNEPSTDLHGLCYGDLFVFTMRGEERPVATMDQDTRVIIKWITNKR